MASPEKQVPVGKRFYEMLKDDTIGYFSEYRCGSIDPTAIAAAAAALSVEVNGHDVVVLAKRGCGACAAASALLADAAAKTPFSLQRRVIADDPIAVAAAEAALGGAWAKTFPIIFVRGVYVGGRDELVAMEGRGALATALAAERAPFSAGKAGDANALSDDVKAMLAPSLFKAPKGGPWARFQWYMFANVVRGQSAAHLLLFAILMVLEPGSPLTMIISFLMILDLLATILIGCAPLAPIGAAATRALWTRRGPAVHSVPYKIVCVRRHDITHIIHAECSYKIVRGVASSPRLSS